ncbi:hypothetical protein CSOJ01_08355 [Colletotrichum sojae]|uniref:BTB domain-containing protein n=1 Tax=Colletotrichum sojae TaxID=2175907 RepID=A0A8H6MS66_9PEZI|nr:hypothetical protein CSOJ01_08355 [Colletotrichum sojae]
MVSNFLDPQRIVTLIAESRRFFVHEHVLTSGSRFFKNYFASSHTPTEPLQYTFSADDDVRAEDLAHYLNFAYCMSLEQMLRSGPPCAVAPGARKADELRAWITDYGNAYEKEIREAILEIFCAYFPLEEFWEHSEDVVNCASFVRDLSVRFSEIIAAREESRRQKKWRRFLAYFRDIDRTAAQWARRRYAES